MRTTFFMLLLLAAGAQAPQRATPPPGPAVPPGVGGAPAGVPAPTAAQAAVIAEVKDFEKACDDAAVRGDAACLKRALADDFVMTHGDGWTHGGMPIKVDTKQSWIEYISKPPPPYVYRNLDSIQVEVHGDVAITIGRYKYVPRSNNPNAAANQSHLYVWFERVYVKRNGEWQFLSHRTTNGPNREPDAQADNRRDIPLPNERDRASMTRLYTGDDKQSHAEDVDIAFDAKGVFKLNDAGGSELHRAKSGTVVDWHPGPRRQYVITLSGHGEIEVAGGRRVAVGPGHIELIEDTTGKGHITRVTGNEDRLTLWLPAPDRREH
jgi:hypothetical protein